MFKSSRIGHKEEIPFFTTMTAVMGMVLMAAGCHAIVEDPSVYAAAAGNSTMLLGSNCRKNLELGYGYCPLVVGETVPKLHLYFLNPAEYAVSNCHLGIHFKGAVSSPGEVEVDLSGLQAEIEAQHFCLLRVEAQEHYPDPRDSTQIRSIPLTGGYFIEVLDKSYFPAPTDSEVSWCVKIRGTNKGRRTLEACPPW